MADEPHKSLTRRSFFDTVGGGSVTLLSGDVTGGYIVIDVERLRQPFQAVADRILEQIE